MDYLKSQKIIHWLMAIAIMIDLRVAQKFGGEMELWDRLESRADHATMGLIITFLFLLRILLRYRYGAPSLPSSMPKWQVTAAQIGHYGLYFLMGTLMALWLCIGCISLILYRLYVGSKENGIQDRGWEGATHP